MKDLQNSFFFNGHVLATWFNQYIYYRCVSCSFSIKRWCGMLKIKVFKTDGSGGSECWINPDHIMQLSEIHESGFAKLVLSDSSKGLVDKEGHEKILNHFKPKKWWQLIK